jgi:hypothetical protein
MNTQNTTIKNFSYIINSIENSCSKAHRNPKHVNLVAVTKNIQPELIIPLLQHGHTSFGENRVQEAQKKWTLLKKQFPDTSLHLIGPLQSNKAKQALELFDFIHTLDRPSLVHALAKAQRQLKKNTPILIQINTGQEPQKAGVNPKEFPELLELALQNKLNIQGVMCIPPLHDQPEEHFLLCTRIAAQFQLPILSFGMSSDFNSAIASGATLVRVGSAIFGTRA